jgi:rubredoxin
MSKWRWLCPLCEAKGTKFIKKYAARHNGKRHLAVEHGIHNKDPTFEKVEESWNMHTRKKKDYSKNPRAERLLGRRGPGTPLFAPHELGYVCPVCGEGNEVNLHWSEYNGFLWCDTDNLDIPSCLCKKYPEPRLTGVKPLSPRIRILEETRIFLDCIADAKKRKPKKL